MTKHKNSLAEVEALLKLAIKYGALELEASGIKVKLSQPISSSIDEAAVNELAAPNMPSDSDMLIWSAGGELPSDLLKAQTASGD